LVQKFSRIKLYNALAVPILLHGSEIWIIEKRIKKEIFRRTAAYTIFDHKGAEEFL
jgi:hypothetical protein